MAVTTIDEVRTAHMEEGATFAAYLSDGTILTAGADCKANIYPALYEDESLSVSIDSKITALAVKDKLVCLSNDKNEVKSYSLPEMKFENTLLRFTGNVNHVSFGDNLIAAASSDFTIKVVSLNGSNQKTLTGHGAPVLSVQFVNADLLISSCCDGTVKIWNLSEQKCIKTLEILPKSNSPVTCHGVLSICAKSKKVAVPSENLVKILAFDSWKEISTLENEHKESVSNVCWSPSGKYLVSGSITGEVFCWDITSKKCIKRYQQQESKGITSLEWKKSNEVLFADEDGEFGICEVPVKEEGIQEKDDFGIEDDDEILATALECEEGHVQNDEDTNDGEIFSSSAAKKSKKRPRAMIDEDDVINGSDDVDSDAVAAKKTRINNMDNFLDDQAEDEEDDEASISLNLIKEGLLEPIRKSVIEDDDDDDAGSVLSQHVDKPTKRIVEAVVPILMQPAFQPSSTPLHLQHRFMVWNSVGIIRSHQDEGVSSIDVEFHNASTSHPLHIANVLSNSMAALSSTAVVFACKKQDDMPSKLTCIHFGSWDNNKEWSLSMAEEEDILAISVNSNHVAVASSTGLLRMLSVGGLQTQLLWLPGPVVSIAMHEKEMALVYHKSAGYKKCQSLGICHFQYKKSSWKMVSESSMNLQAEVTVVWLGFSTEGTPAIVFSSGDVLMYHRGQLSWVVVANTKKQVKNKSDNYWVIGIEERIGQMRCIYCKGANFPALLPRPVPTFIDLQFPLCEMNTEKSKKEHDLMKNKLLVSNISYSQNVLRLPVDQNIEASEKQQMQLLMQLFALACKADREFRAVEICKLMPSAESIGLAIQYASKVRRMNIAKKLTELAQNRAKEEEENDGDEEQDTDNDDFDLEEDDYLSDIGEDDFSDGELGALERKETEHKHLTSTVKIAKFTATNLGRNRVKSNNTNTNSGRPSIESHNDVMGTAEEESNSEESQQLTQSEKSTPRGRLSGNPFKISQEDSHKNNNSSAAKGTDYFETLESQKLSKTKQVTKNINNAVKKRPGIKTKNEKTQTQQKQKTIRAKENIDFNVVNKDDNKKPLTGFQLFLNKKKEEKEDGCEEDFMPAVMRLWKELSADEKKDWNSRANETHVSHVNENTTDNNSKNKSNDLKTINTKNVNDVHKKTSAALKSTSTQNKLSTFAFQKS